jgi:hypothetical protein
MAVAVRVAGGQGGQTSSCHLWAQTSAYRVIILPCHLQTTVRQRDRVYLPSPKTAKTLTDPYLMSALLPKADID